MKCPFCAFENPNHANFCMNCGSPQNLKACEKCDTINQKGATKCHGCGASFLSPATSAEQTSKEAATEFRIEKPALAEEASNLKQLLAELEKDLQRQRSEAQQPTTKHAPSISGLSKPSIDSQEQSINVEPKLEASPPIVVELPSYLKPLLSQQEERRTKRSTGWRIFSLILLLALVCGGIVRYGVVGSDGRSSKTETITNKSVKDTTQQPTQQAASRSSADLSPEENATQN